MFDTSDAAHAQICSKGNNAILTVRHILVTCPDLQRSRDQFIEKLEKSITLKSWLGEEQLTKKVVEYMKSIHSQKKGF